MVLSFQIREKEEAKKKRGGGGDAKSHGFAQVTNHTRRGRQIRKVILADVGPDSRLVGRAPSWLVAATKSVRTSSVLVLSAFFPNIGCHSSCTCSQCSQVIRMLLLEFQNNFSSWPGTVSRFDLLLPCHWTPNTLASPQRHTSSNSQAYLNILLPHTYIKQPIKSDPRDAHESGRIRHRPIIAYLGPR